jgi:hypothetical protein
VNDGHISQTPTVAMFAADRFGGTLVNCPLHDFFLTRAVDSPESKVGKKLQAWLDAAGICGCVDMTARDDDGHSQEPRRQLRPSL